MNRISNTQILTIALIATLVVPSIAIAASPGHLLKNIKTFKNVDNQTVMNYSYDYAACKTNFTVAYAANVESVTGNTEIAANVATFQGDTATLNTYVAKNNLTQFTTYLQGTYDPALKQVNTGIKTTINAASLSSSQLATLSTDYNVSKAQLTPCLYNSITLYADAKIDNYQARLSAAQNQTDAWAAKGYNTTALNATIKAANATIIVPLEVAVNSSTNTTQVWNAVKSYCLYDGCANGTNYHFAAHFTLDGLIAVADKMGAKLNGTASANLTVQAQKPSVSTTAIINASGTNATLSANANANATLKTKNNATLNATLTTTTAPNGVIIGTVRLNATTVAKLKKLHYNLTVITTLQTKLQNAWSHIDNATATLNAVGTAQYKNGQSVEVWSNIHEASHILANIK